MSDIKTKPATPEYEEAWARVFGNKEKILFTDAIATNVCKATVSVKQ